MNLIHTPPELKFRGNRDYLSGTTVFDCIHDQLSDATEIDFQFHKFTANQCRFVSDPQSDEPLVATFRSAGHHFGVVETDQPIESTYACNEAEILAQATLSETVGEFDFPPIASATYLECIVAVYKAMLQQTADADRGKFIFGRVTLNKVPTSGHCLVKHRRKIGKQFFEATLICDDTPIGALYFGQHESNRN